MPHTKSCLFHRNSRCEDLRCLHPLYASTVRPETTPLAIRVPFPVGGSPFCATRRRGVIEPLLPSSDGVGGRPFRDHRQVVEGIIYRYRWND